MLSSNEYRAGNILLEKYLVFVNIAGNEVPGIHYEKLCAFMSSCFNSGCR